MKESKVLYGITDHDDFMAIVWETERGMVITTQGKINPQSNLRIKNAETGSEVDDIDLRNFLFELLPQ